MFSDITLAYDDGECLYAYRNYYSATRTLFVRIWKISPNLYPLNCLQGIELLVIFLQKCFFFAFNLGEVYCFWFRPVFFRNCVLLGNTTLTRTSEISCSLRVQSRGKLEGHRSGPKFGAPSTSGPNEFKRVQIAPNRSKYLQIAPNVSKFPKSFN